ncbi:MAG: CHAP domain-containing protein [Candidatus Gastranaerophilales bacterium]|nr:CHAP domain-containing protein [Candidatus Gastranaerophilales bacterium]
MSEFTIAGYTIETQTIYNALVEAGVDSADDLKKIDLNSDMTITEDELVEFTESQEEEDDETTGTGSTSTASSNLDTQIEAYNSMINSLEAATNKLISELGVCDDLEEMASIEQQIASNNDEIQSYENKIYNLLVSSENSTDTSTSTSTYATTGTGIAGTTEFGSSIVSIAESYVGQLKESDGSYLAVTGGRSEAWCADFVTYVVKQAASETGTDLNGFGSSSVSGLKAWGEANNCYGDITGMSSSERAAWIVENVSPGDVMIQKSNGASHTGIVTAVYADGSFDTVEGNTSDQCLERHYSADSSKLSGFIDIT